MISCLSYILPNNFLKDANPEKIVFFWWHAKILLFEKLTNSKANLGNSSKTDIRKTGSLLPYCNRLTATALHRDPHYSTRVVVGFWKESFVSAVEQHLESWLFRTFSILFTSFCNMCWSSAAIRYIIPLPGGFSKWYAWLGYHR